MHWFHFGWGSARRLWGKGLTVLLAGLMGPTSKRREKEERRLCSSIISLEYALQHSRIALFYAVHRLCCTLFISVAYPMPLCGRLANCRHDDITCAHVSRVFLRSSASRVGKWNFIFMQETRYFRCGGLKMQSCGLLVKTTICQLKKLKWSR